MKRLGISLILATSRRLLKSLASPPSGFNNPIDPAKE
jgi:hypothetical protein